MAIKISREKSAGTHQTLLMKMATTAIKTLQMWKRPTNVGKEPINVGKEPTNVGKEQ